MAALELELSDGTKMPQIAFGLYLVAKEDCGACVKAAVASGYRHFDGAAFYDNEAAAGAALPADAFYTTKVWTTDRTFEQAVASVERSRREIGRTIDLALVHWPVPGRHLEQYRALVHCRDVLRIVERVGLSNYTPADYEELEASGVMVGAPPVANQIEVSPFLYRKDCVDYFQSRGIVVQAFKPLQRGKALDDPVVASIAAARGASAARVLVRWGVQKNLNVCVKSSKAERIAANIDVGDLELTADDMQRLDALTTPAAVEGWRAHYEKRRAGTAAPWGDAPRPAA